MSCSAWNKLHQKIVAIDKEESILEPITQAPKEFHARVLGANCAAPV
jgi:hypothetical protein